MTRDLQKLLRRLAAEGVQFPSGLPDRAHNHVHGELRDTFLAYRVGYGSHRRELLDDGVDFVWNGCEGTGVLLYRSVRRLATCWALELSVTDEGGWGCSLAVSDAVDCQIAREYQDARYLEWGY